MKNSAMIKMLTGLVCVLLVVAGIIWFFVYKQHQENKEGEPQTVAEATATPIAQQPEEVGGEEPEVAPTKGPEETAQEPEAAPTDEPLAPADERLGNPRNTKLEPTDLANRLGITKENYPRIDGSTSTFGLVSEIYWRLFEYKNDEYDDNAGYPIAPAKTIPSYKELIAGNVDLIIVPDPSQAVRDLEKELGVELEYIPIGVEGLVFITSDKNQVSDITVDQVNEIYVDRTITNWSQLGGNDGEILALCRNDDSGSQAQFENMVLEDGKEINPEIKEKYSLGDMSIMIYAVAGMEETWVDGKPVTNNNSFPLGYSIYYYMANFDDNDMPEGVKTLSVDNVTASPETIASKEYPLTVGYYAVIRKSTPQNAPERAIANWLTIAEGQETVQMSGLGRLAQ